MLKFQSCSVSCSVREKSEKKPLMSKISVCESVLFCGADAMDVLQFSSDCDKVIKQFLSWKRVQKSPVFSVECRFSDEKSDIISRVYYVKRVDEKALVMYRKGFVDVEISVPFKGSAVVFSKWSKGGEN